MKEQPVGQNQWLNSLSLDGHYLQSLLSTLQRMSHRTELTKVSAPVRKRVEGLFSTQLTEPRTPKKPEIRKSIRVTDPPAPLTKTTFQQQGASANEDRNRSQNPIKKYRSILNQTKSQVIYQQVPSSGSSGLPKLKLTEFSGDPLEWPDGSGLFDVVVHQKPISDTETYNT